VSSRKKGSPLDALQKRDLPRLDEAPTAQQADSTQAQPHANSSAQSHSSAEAQINSNAIVPMHRGENAHNQEEDKEATSASNVTLPVSMWNWIDDRHREIQRSGWRAVRKASVIRAVIEAAMKANIDLSGVTSEEEITDRVIRALKQ
jgi:hypothetical protein